jgi:hypothetical protein
MVARHSAIERPFQNFAFVLAAPVVFFSFGSFQRRVLLSIHAN